MKKVKLPRKRKKAYIKARGKSNYLGLQLLSEVLSEQGKKNADRFYTYDRCEATRKNPNGYKIFCISLHLLNNKCFSLFLQTSQF